MTGDRGLLYAYKEKSGGGSVTFGDNKKGQIKNYGVIANGDIDVNRVAYVDGLKHNLLSVSQLCDNGLDVMFKKKFSSLLKEDTTTELLRAKRRDDLYLMDFKSINRDEKLFLVSSKNEEAWLWHNRFCHLNFHSLDKLVKLDLVKGLPSIKFDKDHLCSACEMGKLKRAAHKTKTDMSCTRPLQMLHVDLWGPISVQSLGGKKYIFVLIDEFSRYTWVEFVRKKSYVTENSTIEAYLKTEGISQNFSAARTPKQNGVVERKNRTFVEAARTMLTALGLPIFFWAEAISTTCFTQNRSLVVKRHEKTPYHLLNQRKSNIKYFHVFGCRCFVLNDIEKIGKFSPKADEAKAYRVCVLKSKHLLESINVSFDDSFQVTFEQIRSGLKLQDEDSGSSSRTNDLQHLFEEMFNDDGPSVGDRRASEAEPSEDQTGSTSEQSEISDQDSTQLSISTHGEQPSPVVSTNDQFPSTENDLHQDERAPELSTEVSNDHLPGMTKWTKSHPQSQIIGDPSDKVQTRSSTANFCYYINFMSIVEPKKISEALEDPNWVEAMQEELLQFERNKVWTLVPLPKGKTAIGTKWVLRNKKDEDGVVVRDIVKKKALTMKKRLPLWHD
ncbi:hypothetical protein L6452_43674 [Arctium lappa]|uniref:Uncharacterized protein n=1 Tax=Arctium lappa TaxID=4217 RepID=A0ACB8XDP5_ARCLA|nr:hypothetical protein L6452_43674 [Arctium lappa]